MVLPKINYRLEAFCFGFFMNVDKSLDRIYDMVFDWINKEDFAQVDAYLANINYTIHLNLFDATYEPSYDDTTLWIGALTATAFCKAKLKNRKCLYDFVLRFTDEETMQGLE